MTKVLYSGRASPIDNYTDPTLSTNPGIFKEPCLGILQFSKGQYSNTSDRLPKKVLKIKVTDTVVGSNNIF